MNRHLTLTALTDLNKILDQDPGLTFADKNIEDALDRIKGVDEGSFRAIVLLLLGRIEKNTRKVV